MYFSRLVKQKSAHGTRSKNGVSNRTVPLGKNKQCRRMLRGSFLVMTLGPVQHTSATQLSEHQAAIPAYIRGARWHAKEAQLINELLDHLSTASPKMPKWLSLASPLKGSKHDCEHRNIVKCLSAPRLGAWVKTVVARNSICVASEDCRSRILLARAWYQTQTC